MKLSVGIAQHGAEEDAYVVFRGFEQSIQTAKELGYDGVEIAIKQKEDIDLTALEKSLQRYDLEVSCINTGQVFSARNLYLTNPDSYLREKAIDVFLDLIGVASSFGKRINVGRARGFYGPGQTREQAESLFIDSMSRIMDVADKHGVGLLVEPINRYEINFINSTDECAELLRWMPYDHIGMMPDLFHMNIEDGDIGGTLTRHRHLIKYIHLADSNRLAPGWGHIDFDKVFQGLEQTGYRGWACMEILPHPTAKAAAKQAIEHIRPYVEIHNRNLRLLTDTN